MDLERHRRVDAAIVDAAKNIRVLSRLSWPAETMARFLDDWKSGTARLPHVEYPHIDDLADSTRALTNAVASLRDMDDPVADYLRSTARSYVDLCRLLAHAGDHSMLEISRRLYGAPGDLLSDGSVNNLDAAHYFLDHSRQYHRIAHLREADYCIPAQIVKQEMQARLTEVFPPDLVQIKLDSHLASKAVAGPSRIRLRNDTCFSSYDVEQLLQHEAFVHSLTALNGRHQTNIRTLSLGAPRTTGSQEGLATFAELVTGAIDIDRMERIALRVVAIDMAIGGADFIDVFRFFLDADQTEMESFNSSMRVFRGAPLTGGAAFTKDVVYLHGLMEVHTFFRWALLNQRLELCRNFFAGRMTISDAIALSPMFESGLIAGPSYLPPWMMRANGLAGYLAFSVFANRISIEALGEHHNFENVKDISDST